MSISNIMLHMYIYIYIYIYSTIHESLGIPHGFRTKSPRTDGGSPEGCILYCTVLYSTLLTTNYYTIIYVFLGEHTIALTIHPSLLWANSAPSS